jgi:hypothetical protein
MELGIEVRHPVSLKGAEEKEAFAALNADVAVVAAYGLLLPARCWRRRCTAASTCMARSCRAGAGGADPARDSGGR